MAKANRQVAMSTIGSFTISTVFLGEAEVIENVKPKLFRTDILGSTLAATPRYFSTWLEAVREHKNVISDLRHIPVHRVERMISRKVL